MAVTKWRGSLQMGYLTLIIRVDYCSILVYTHIHSSYIGLQTALPVTDWTPILKSSHHSVGPHHGYGLYKVQRHKIVCTSRTADERR